VSEPDRSNWKNTTFQYKSPLSHDELIAKFKSCKNYGEFVKMQNAPKVMPVIECSPALRKEIEDMLSGPEENE
jgi:hypothetical protein